MPDMLKQAYKKINRTEGKEKRGAYGAWRKEFCRKYSELLIQIQNNTYNALVETLTPRGEKVTCRKGCVHCCYHYVAVSLGQGILIIDHLYKNKELLKLFLANYEKWYPKGHSISDSIDRMRIQALSSSLPIERILADTRPLSNQYLEMSIRCPFLADDRCLIYAVRPLPCLGHYSVSPPEWCASGTRQEPVIHHVIPTDQDLVDIIRLGDPGLVLYELTLPTMIYKLLIGGSSSIMTEMLQYGL